MLRKPYTNLIIRLSDLLTFKCLIVTINKSKSNSPPNSLWMNS